MQDTADLVFGIHISSKIMSFFQPNQLEEILVEWYIEKWIQFWRWHITTLTIWYKLQICLFWQFWQKGTILTGQARRQWSVLGPIEINFIHTQKNIHISNYTSYHLHLLPWYFDVDESLCVDFQWRSSFRCTVPAAVTATVIKTYPYQYSWVNSVDYQLKIFSVLPHTIDL